MLGLPSPTNDTAAMTDIWGDLILELPPTAVQHKAAQAVIQYYTHKQNTGCVGQLSKDRQGTRAHIPVYG
jgi:hypothetical protein